jgi:hypothetical protein
LRPFRSGCRRLDKPSLCPAAEEKLQVVENIGSLIKTFSLDLLLLHKDAKDTDWDYGTQQFKHQALWAQDISVMVYKRPRHLYSLAQ